MRALAIPTLCTAVRQNSLPRGQCVALCAATASAPSAAAHDAARLQVFNPPYVPTPDEEVSLGGIASAWAGGFKGRRVIDQVLPQVRALHAGVALQGGGWSQMDLWQQI